MKKVFIHREDSVDAAASKMAEAEDADLILVIPRNSKVGATVEGIRSLRDEAAGQGKRIVIESVDERVLAFAEENKLENFHPLFSGAKAISDIVPGADSRPGAKKLRAKKEPAKPKKAAKKINLRVVPQAEPEEGEAEEMEEPEELPIREMPAPAPIRSYEPPEVMQEDESSEEEPMAMAEEPGEEADRPRRFGWGFRIIALALLAGAGAWVASAFFARADVTVNFKTIPWTYENTFIADMDAAETDAVRRVIPAEVFRDERNVTQLFPASGRANVSQKASGRITIYNTYSSQPQTLVATTRFETPEGKIYRLDSQVVVPGAEVKDGKIIPSSIKAQVSADKAGPDYNTEAVPKLTIPGFKGTPRFTGFYGSLEEGAKDGFVGERAVPTDADVEQAREKTSEILRASLQTNILSKRPKDFKILEEVSGVEITRLTVNRNTDANGNFSVIGEAKLQAIGFREGDLKELLLRAAQADQPGMAFHELSLDYRDAQPVYDRGELRFTLAAEGKLTSEFSEEDFKRSVAGENVNTARSMILKLPNLSDAKVSLWPFWLRSLPDDPAKIRLYLNYL